MALFEKRSIYLIEMSDLLDYCQGMFEGWGELWVVADIKSRFKKIWLKSLRISALIGRGKKIAAH